MLEFNCFYIQLHCLYYIFINPCNCKKIVFLKPLLFQSSWLSGWCWLFNSSNGYLYDDQLHNKYNLSSFTSTGFSDEEAEKLIVMSLDILEYIKEYAMPHLEHTMEAYKEDEIIQTEAWKSKLVLAATHQQIMAMGKNIFHNIYSSCILICGYYFWPF